MSRIGDLIAEHCPDGVPFVRLSEVGDWYGGSTPSKSNLDFWADGEVPWLTPKDMTSSPVGKTEDHVTKLAIERTAIRLVPAGSVALVMRSNILRKRLPIAKVAFGVTLNQDMRAVVPRDGVALEYLSQVCRAWSEEIRASCGRTDGSMAAISGPKLMDFTIPLPPPVVQDEIARVLLRMEMLQAELQAELQARTRQFEHYRDQLVNSLSLSLSTAKRLEMSDLGSIFGGLVGKSKADFDEGESRFVSYKNVFANVAADLSRTDFVRVGPNERQRELRRGDVLFTGSSESKGEVAMSSVVTSEPDQPTYLNSFSIGFRPHDSYALLPEFSKHLFRSDTMRSQLVRTANGVTRFNVSKARLAKVLVPVPPVEEQQRVAATLDTFYALVNDLSVGLPAEIAARKKQYEHYRDKLLIFPEEVDA